MFSKILVSLELCSFYFPFLVLMGASIEDWFVIFGIVFTKKKKCLIIKRLSFSFAFSFMLFISIYMTFLYVFFPHMVFSYPFIYFLFFLGSSFLLPIFMYSPLFVAIIWWFPFLLSAIACGTMFGELYILKYGLQCCICLFQLSISANIIALLLRNSFLILLEFWVSKWLLISIGNTYQPIFDLFVFFFKCNMLHLRKLVPHHIGWEDCSH